MFPQDARNDGQTPLERGRFRSRSPRSGSCSLPRSPPGSRPANRKKHVDLSPDQIGREPERPPASPARTGLREMSSGLRRSRFAQALSRGIDRGGSRADKQCSRRPPPGPFLACCAMAAGGAPSSARRRRSQDRNHGAPSSASRPTEASVPFGYGRLRLGVVATMKEVCTSSLRCSLPAWKTRAGSRTRATAPSPSSTASGRRSTCTSIARSTPSAASASGKRWSAGRNAERDAAAPGAPCAALICLTLRALGTGSLALSKHTSTAGKTYWTESFGATIRWPTWTRAVWSDRGRPNVTRRREPNRHRVIVVRMTTVYVCRTRGASSGPGNAVMPFVIQMASNGPEILREGVAQINRQGGPSTAFCPFREGHAFPAVRLEGHVRGVRSSVEGPRASRRPGTRSCAP